MQQDLHSTYYLINSINIINTLAGLKIGRICLIIHLPGDCALSTKTFQILSRFVVREPDGHFILSVNTDHATNK